MTTTFVPLDWSSKRQPICTDSSSGAELIAAHAAMRHVLLTAQFTQKCLCGQVGTVILGIDNTAVRALIRTGMSQQLAFLGHNKFLRVRMALLRQMAEMGLLVARWADTRTNRADMMTKPFGRLEQTRLAGQAGLR